MDATLQPHVVNELTFFVVCRWGWAFCIVHSNGVLGIIAASCVAASIVAFVIVMVVWKKVARRVEERNAMKHVQQVDEQQVAAL
eukprot:3309108-Pyramimonas_sp.AAC.2